MGSRTETETTTITAHTLRRDYLPLVKPQDRIQTNQLITKFAHEELPGSTCIQLLPAVLTGIFYRRGIEIPKSSLINPDPKTFEAHH